jgi:2-dehydropantoate 2-reductase
MKVSVLGAGAIGSIFGGLLRHHDPEVEVLLIARGEHAERMRSSGELVLDGPWGIHRVPIQVSENIQDIAGSDFILVTVKSQATKEIISAAADHLGDATVISIQNGINQVVLREFVHPDRLVMAITTTNVELPEPGTARVTLSGPTTIGAASGEAPPELVERSVELLRKTTLSIETTPNILGVQYNKLTLNAMGYASVLSASRFVIEGILHRPWRKAVALPILTECLRVLDAANIRLERKRGLSDIYRFRRLLRWLDFPPLQWLGNWAMRRVKGRIVYSLQHDLNHGKPTEIEYLNGEFVRLAAAHHVPAPYNTKVVEMVHELEQRPPGSVFSRDEVIAAFRAIARTGSAAPAATRPLP